MQPLEPGPSPQALCHLSQSPHTPYLHKGVEAGLPESLPVLSCLKMQLVGARLGLSRCQEGLAAPICIRVPETRPSQSCCTPKCSPAQPPEPALAVPPSTSPATSRQTPGEGWAASCARSLWPSSQSTGSSVPAPFQCHQLSYLCASSVHSIPGSCSRARRTARPAAGSPEAVFSTWVVRVPFPTSDMPSACGRGGSRAGTCPGSTVCLLLDCAAAKPLCLALPQSWDMGTHVLPMPRCSAPGTTATVRGCQLVPTRMQGSVLTAAPLSLLACLSWWASAQHSSQPEPNEEAAPSQQPHPCPQCHVQKDIDPVHLSGAV